MKSIFIICILLFMATMSYAQEFKQKVHRDVSNIALSYSPRSTKAELREDLFPSKDREARSTWESLISYLNTEAKIWNTNKYIGKDVLFKGLIVGREGNLLHVRNSTGLHYGPSIFDCFIETQDKIGKYFVSDTTTIEVLGSIKGINKGHQIFVKAKKIVITASE